MLAPISLPTKRSEREQWASNYDELFLIKDYGNAVPLRRRHGEMSRDDARRREAAEEH